VHLKVPAGFGGRLRGKGPQQRDLAAQPILLALELAQHGCGVSLVDEEKTVEEFAADGADEAFGDRVRPRRTHRCLEDLDVDGGEDGVEGGGELVGR
jgi:hypothetical protein